MTASAAAVLGGEKKGGDVLFVGAGLAGAALTGAAVAVSLASDQPGDRYLVALASALVVGVPVGVGMIAWRAGEYARFGRLLVFSGLVSFLPVLAFSNDPTAYSVGRIGVWIAEPIAIAVILAFPTGRLRTRLERGIALLMALDVALLFVPTALLVERYPEPALWSPCVSDCPENVFMVAATEPAFVDALVRPVREMILIAGYVALAFVLVRRLQASTAIGKRMLSPVLTVAVGRSLIIAGGLALRRTSPGSAAFDALSWLFVLTLPALAVAFAIGLLRARLFASKALQELAVRLQYQRQAADVRDCLAATLDDPRLDVAYWLPDAPGRWVDAEGNAVRLPENDPDESVTEIREGGRRVAAFVHDSALGEQRPFVEAAGTFALTALENQRLKAQVNVSLESLLESRARIQAAADSERMRIERNLHDGAQQRLVALRIRLELASEALRDDPAAGPRLLQGLGEEVEVALDEVRALGRGIYPSLLADRGLADAVADAARRELLPTTVETGGLGRYAAEIEAAVYFCCLEALQNVARHATGATTVAVSVVDDGDGTLAFEVRDDGRGFSVDRTPRGAGLVNMRDRIEAVGGTVRVQSTARHGTTVSGVVPLP